MKEYYFKSTDDKLPSNKSFGITFSIIFLIIFLFKTYISKSFNESFVLLIISIILFSCNQDTKEKLVVYQSPTCGCCSGWVSIMEQNGFNVESIKTNDMYSAKVKAGIDYTLQSCHTAFIGNYFVEGHVPSDAITKLLLENPDIKGITVPGMPAGSNVPGMETINERAEFDVLAVNHDGSTFIWKKYQ